MTDEQALRRRIGQLLVFGFDGLTVPDHVRTLIQEHYLGNIILFSRNVSTQEQVAQLNQDLQSLARNAGQELPLTISADQENGIVRRLPEDLPVFPGSMAMGATDNPQDAYRVGVLTGRLLRALGINFNLAPVLDVNNNPANPVIGVRSFSDVAATVAAFGVAMTRGLQSEGVIACGKHFPGHGDTNVDSHLDLPTIVHGRERLDALELVPFKAAIDAGIDSIMTAHVVFPAVEPDRIPATLSRRVLTDLLRTELGFTGVLTTDCLEMNAISETVGVGPGAVAAIKAGADMVMVSHQLERQMAAVNAIFEAVRSGELSEARIDEAYQRVTALKAKRVQEPRPDAHWPALIQDASALQEELSEAAVTALSRSAAPLPAAPKRVAVLVDETAPQMVAAGRGGHNPLVQNAVKAVFPDAQVEEFVFPAVFETADEATLLTSFAPFDAVIAGINGTRNERYLAFVRTLQQQPIPHVTLLLRSPYDAEHVPEAPNLFALYENTPWMAQAAVRAAFGGKAGGALPVHVSDQFPRGHRA